MKDSELWNFYGYFYYLWLAFKAEDLCKTLKIKKTAEYYKIIVLSFLIAFKSKSLIFCHPTFTIFQVWTSARRVSARNGLFAVWRCSIAQCLRLLCALNVFVCILVVVDSWEIAGCLIISENFEWKYIKLWNLLWTNLVSPTANILHRIAIII